MIREITNDDIKRLTTEEKNILEGYEVAIKDATNKVFIIDDRLGLMGNDTVIGKMVREVAEKTIEQVWLYMELQKMAMVVAWLDDHSDTESD